MMRTRSLAACLAGVLAAPVWPANAAPLQACDVKLNVTDQDPAGLNVRSAPGGAVIATLKARARWVQVHVTSDADGWAAIDGATLIEDETGGGESPLFKGHGFVAFSKLGFEELDTQSRILAAPADGARVLLSISQGDEAKLPKATVLGCSGSFLKVRVSGIVGWTQTFCANQLTTCV